MKNLNALDWTALTLLIIGGINWGVISVSGIDLVSTLFGAATMLSRIVYGLVGISALYTIYILTARTQ